MRRTLNQFIEDTQLKLKLETTKEMYGVESIIDEFKANLDDSTCGSIYVKDKTKNKIGYYFNLASIEKIIKEADTGDRITCTHKTYTQAEGKNYPYQKHYFEIHILKADPISDTNIMFSQANKIKIHYVTWQKRQCDDSIR